MTSAVLERPVEARAANGGAPARRAVMRWAWRLFRHEWRQQLLVLALIIVAVAALFVAAAVATNNPTPANVGFGSAKDLATFEGPVPHLAARVAALERRFGRVEVIENETLTIPGTTETYQLRAESSHGPFSGGSLLSLVSGRYPSAASEVALTQSVASAFNLGIGSNWTEAGVTRKVVGIVEDPLDTLDEFALVVPGQVRSPSDTELLFDAPGVSPASIGPNVESLSQVESNNAINPVTIIAMVAVLGMVLIALVSIGGFTVLAQRRLRSLGLLAANGATTKHVRLVVRTNGAIVGLVGTAIGDAIGLVVWLIYRPTIEGTAHHVIGAFQLPWVVIGPAMGLAIVATHLAAGRPARTVATVPVHEALSGRPMPPRKIRRSVVPGVVFFVIAFVLLSFASVAGGASPRTPFLVLGLIALIPAVILLAPFCLAFAARIGHFLPIGPRLALRDLYRYRARSGSAMAAISVAVLAAVVTAAAASLRYDQYLDYAGPNLASNEVVVYAPLPGGTIVSGPGIPPHPTPKPPPMATLDAKVHEIATALGGKSTLELLQTNASLEHAAPGRNWSGAIYVATPQLLREFGIKASTVNPDADILTWRPGIAGLSRMQLTWGNGGGGSCPKSSCIWNPTIQYVGSFPSGTSAPNTVITEHAIRTLHLQTSLAGWFMVTNHPPSAAQIRNARFIAATVSGMSIETKSSAPPGYEVIDLATVFGIVLALAILALSIGLIRSETAGDLRTLTATGASGWTRRTITAATAGALGFFGAVLGTFAAYLGLVAFVRSNSLNGGESALISTVPVNNLLEILVAMPIAAAVVAWLLAGREPTSLTRQAIE
ncbi:MAG: ABC transporter permease [Acidimicrobiales bacterium]|jgi:putative ABC transport system permease protein